MIQRWKDETCHFIKWVWFVKNAFSEYADKEDGLRFVIDTATM